MAGNRSGGLKAKAKILAKDPEHYKRIGARGGSGGGGFHNNPEAAREAGLKGVEARKRNKQLRDEDRQ